MRLPGPLNWLSLAASAALATAPAAMAVFMIVEGSYGAAVLYGLAAAVMFAIPELFVRVLPGPGELVRAAGRRILDAVVPWRDRQSESE